MLIVESLNNDDVSGFGLGQFDELCGLGVDVLLDVGVGERRLFGWGGGQLEVRVVALVPATRFGLGFLS